MAQRVSAGEARTTLLVAASEAIGRMGGSALVEAALGGRARPSAGGGAASGEVIWIAGAGKAVAAMVRGARRALVDGERDGCRPGVLIGKDEPGAVAEVAAPDGVAGAAWPVRGAGHPLPDERSVHATEALLAWLGGLDESEHVVFLLSGGASALLGAPADGVTLEMLQRSTKALLARGAPIGDINIVRRHLGRALGGRLAAATRARLDVLALSDVIGDDPAAIGSGPASADPTTFAGALAVARRYGLDAAVISHCERGAAGDFEETIKPGDPRLARVRYRILATPSTLRDTAASLLAGAGWTVDAVPALVDGDVDAVADEIAAAAAALAPGTVRVAVGEPTVRVAPGGGRGGRSQQLALAVARRIAGTEATFLALASDGSDGPTDAAGAIVDGATWARARALGLDPERHLAACDALPLLAAAGALLRTGPTGTNLLDLHLLMRA